MAAAVAIINRLHPINSFLEVYTPGATPSDLCYPGVWADRTERFKNSLGYSFLSNIVEWIRVGESPSAPASVWERVA